MTKSNDCVHCGELLTFNSYTKAHKLYSEGAEDKKAMYDIKTGNRLEEKEEKEDEEVKECQHQRTFNYKTYSGPHYAKELCLDCGCFIKWLKNPKVTDTFNRRRAVIEGLLENNMNQYDRQFLEDISKRRVLTPKQNAYFQRVASRYK